MQFIFAFKHTQKASLCVCDDLCVCVRSAQLLCIILEYIKVSIFFICSCIFL